VPDDEISFARQIDMRYFGQSHELTIDVPGTTLDEAAADAVVAAFHVEHNRAYGHSTPGEPVEFVNVRVTAIGRIAKPRLREIARNGAAPARALKGTRPVFFAEGGGFVDCDIFDRYLLSAGTALEGPAVVEEFDTTTVVHPGTRAVVDDYGNLLLRTTIADEGR
jgi:N-methylhydantoinase A